MDKEKQLELLKSDLIIAQNKLNDIQKNFIALSDELEKEKKNIWKPHQKGFFITGDSNDIGAYNKDVTNVHNCFRNKEIAKIRQKQKPVEDELFNIWEHLVGEWRPNWNITQNKYRLSYNSIQKVITTFENTTMVEAPQYYYFPNYELPKKFYDLASENSKAYLRGEF